MLFFIQIKNDTAIMKLRAFIWQEKVANFFEGTMFGNWNLATRQEGSIHSGMQHKYDCFKLILGKIVSHRFKNKIKVRVHWIYYIF